MTDESTMPIGYDGENDRVYFISGGNIYQKIGEQDPQLLRVMPDMPIEEGAPIAYRKQAAEALLGLPGDTFAYVTESELCVQEAVPIGDVLKVYSFNNEAKNSAATKLYQQTHPYVQMEFFSQSSPEIDSIVFDIATTSNEDNLFYLQRNDLVLDLSESNTIRALYQSFFPQGQEALGVNGNPLAIPLSMEINPWFYDAEMWTEIGLPPPPKTMDEFFALVHLWTDECQDKYPDYVIFGEGFHDSAWSGIMATLKNQYIYEHGTEQQPIDFDTPQFRKMLEDVRHVSPDLPTLPSSKMSRLLRGNYGLRRLWASMASITSGGVSDQAAENGCLGRQYVPILPPSLTEGQPPKVGALMTTMVILKETQNLPFALDYVTFMAAHATLQQSDLYMMLSPDLMAPPLVDEQTCAFYRQAVHNITFYIGGLGSSYDEYDNSVDFYMVYRNAPTANTIEHWEGYDELIVSLNDSSKLIMENLDFGMEYGGW